MWLISEWRKLGSPAPFQLVELGPGRGSLSRDILKVFTQLKLAGKFSMHLVEISPTLSKIQAQRFCYNHRYIGDDPEVPYYQMGETATGTEAYWYNRLEDVPQGFSLIVAHEFFDALPIHKMQKENGLWKEVLIDVNDKKSAKEADFRFVMSKSQTPMSKIYQPGDYEQRECLEYSLETDRIIKMISKRIYADGGIGLIMDYGHYGEKTDTFRVCLKG